MNTPASQVFFVSRHAGAREWLRRKGYQASRVVEHLDVNEVNHGDTVIGTLPIHLAARVCEAGAAFVFLSLDLPSDARGRELGPDDLDRYNARLEAFHVSRRDLPRG